MRLLAIAGGVLVIIFGLSVLSVLISGGALSILAQETAGALVTFLGVTLFTLGFIRGRR
jgi:hypothetical protein